MPSSGRPAGPLPEEKEEAMGLESLLIAFLPCGCMGRKLSPDNGPIVAFAVSRPCAEHAAEKAAPIVVRYVPREDVSLLVRPQGL